MGTTNVELISMIQKLKIPNFRGVIMRDEFTKLGKPWDKEYGIYNLEESDEDGSHWCAWIRKNNQWYHFCSYGSDACREFTEYANEPILSSTFQIQEFSESICGELCVLVIYLMSQGIEFEDAVLALV